MIWTHNMKDITYHDTFTPTGGPPSLELHDGNLS